MENSRAQQSKISCVIFPNPSEFGLSVDIYFCAVIMAPQRVNAFQKALRRSLTEHKVNMTSIDFAKKLQHIRNKRMDSLLSKNIRNFTLESVGFR